ncbi:putative NADH-flavin reductase [Lysinibacillus composti]|uniref:NAD(P)-dependent oxidoreductase n=1 Tax=Lysinibacillus composti TaxID=720633 RepID=A0A3N9UBU8_9BACI|nr:NAD(P)H-binding protein [Lysinibacillus composti]MBM7609595.1 putative NADH-flavin reductase [Lysinibacillus composti]RQW73933.1 NAD(P)-dependent oxidoreductase [Lysinibacillus composti]
MKIGIIGANGKAGENILREALLRGFDVTAIVRNKEKLYIQDIPIIEKEIFDLTRNELSQFDVVVNAFEENPGEQHLYTEVGRHLISLLEDTHTKLFVIGGAGSLIVDTESSTHLIGIPNLSEKNKEIAKQRLEILRFLQQSSIRWTFLSPSIIFDADGPRTGHYILGKGRILLNSQYLSYVSYADYAIAVIDEIENPQFENEQVIVASENATIAS